jgi:hypothetical protein
MANAIDRPPVTAKKIVPNAAPFQKWYANPVQWELAFAGTSLES